MNWLSWIIEAAIMGIGGFVGSSLALRNQHRICNLERRRECERVAREALDRTQTNIRQMYGGARP